MFPNDIVLCTRNHTWQLHADAQSARANLPWCKINFTNAGCRAQVSPDLFYRYWWTSSSTLSVQYQHLSSNCCCITKCIYSTQNEFVRLFKMAHEQMPADDYVGVIRLTKNQSANTKDDSTHQQLMKWRSS